MARALSEVGVKVDVVTTDDDGPGKRLGDVCHGVPVRHEGFRAFYFSKQTEFYKVSLPLLVWLFRNVVNYDVVHVHAVFSFSTLVAGWACWMRGVPYVVRPLGVLNSWGMENRRRRLKAWSFRLLDKPVLDHAAVIHYTSQQEADEADRLGIRARPAVIPLGIDLKPFQNMPSPELFTDRFPAAVGRPVILFLSRLDPKKNVEALLDAFSLLLAAKSDPPRPDPTRSDPILIIAGSGHPGYVAGLEARASGLGIQKDVIWTGHLEGEMKLSAFAATTVYVLPSHSENFGIALLEAMAAGCACLSTKGVALADESAWSGAVKLCEPESASIAEAVETLLAHALERATLARNAADVVTRKYSLEKSMDTVMELYKESVALT